MKLQNLLYSLIYPTVNWMKLNHKFTNNGFRMVITWETRNIWSLISLKDKNDYKSCVIYKGVCSVVHVTLAKPNIMQRLDWTNIIIHLKVQNYQALFYTDCNFKCSTKCKDQEKLRGIIYCSLKTWSLRTKGLWKTSFIRKTRFIRNGVT